jgi:hypothetical protein
MSTCNLTTQIPGSECIGESRVRINSNFAALESISCDLSSLATSLSGDLGTLFACCVEARQSVSSVARTLAQIRISPSSTQPVVVEDRLNVTTVYVHPYNGNTVGMFNTSTNRWDPVPVTSVLSTSLSSLGANTNYDVYLSYDGTVFSVGFEAWSTSFVSASAGVPAPTYTYLDGVRCKPDGAYYKRLIGCLRTTSTAGQTEISFGRKWVLNGSHPKFYIWNAQNKVSGAFSIYDGATWAIAGAGYGTASTNGPFSNFGYRNGTTQGTGNRISFITGDTQTIEMNQSHWSSGGWAYLTHGLNLEQASSPRVVDLHRQGQSVSEEQGQIIHSSKFIVPAGFHYVQQLAMSYGSMTYWVYEGPTSGGNVSYPGGRHSYGAVGTIASY